ncbi:MAG TPA: ATP-binding cassette domain-containing protein [Solirubrobacteraceae bacterium]|nr:ATP-binding cassette domain-containing protein [Solirubrobacteraceae bacterium]
MLERGITAIEASGLTKRYRPDQPPAVDGLSFRVEAGEIYGLLGPNGSGKSTTVSILATLARPTAGEARILGHDVVREPMTVRRLIGVALQDAGLDRAATGREILILHACLLGLPAVRAAERADRLLKELDLADAAQRRVGTYSGGMRRRLDLAVAIVGDPAVVILDEPTTGLDVASREALWARVLELRDRGAAILLTTQYLEEADRLADRVGILARGALRAEGPPGELKERHGASSLDEVFFAVTGLPRPSRRELTAIEQ